LVGILRLIWESENQKVNDLGQGHQGQSQGQRSKKLFFFLNIRGKKFPLRKFVLLRKFFETNLEIVSNKNLEIVPLIFT
jgi:hypothetical protein